MMSVEQSVELELGGETNYSQKTCPHATLSTTNPTWPDLGWNPGRRVGKPATDRLSYGTAHGPCCVPVCVSHPVNFWMTAPISMKLYT
jgi:hypothetical protein